MLSLTRPDPAALDAVVADQEARSLTYGDVGATRGPLPGGYRHGRHAVELGQGDDLFRRASEGLRRWQAHRRGGALVAPEDAAVEEGQTVVLAVHVLAAYLTVACRIVYVVDQPGQFGFAYGTLPQHVIEGEECFRLERDDAGAVRFSVTSFLRPRSLLVRAGGPLVKVTDDLLVRRYLRGFRRHVAEEA